MGSHIMEQNLQSIIDQIESLELSEIHDGLHNIDQLLAHVCQVENIANSDSLALRLEKNGDLNYFLKYQDGFEYNLSCRLVCAIKVLTKNQDIVLALNLLQGLVLLHYPSRRLFLRPSNMKMLVSLLNPTVDSTIQLAVVNTLVAVMVREVPNIRLFEKLGLQEICSLFKQKDTTKEVKLRILEFLFFYLIPETRNKTKKSSQKDPRRTTEDKQVLLSNYLSNVKGLVRELNTSKPFGDMNLEW